MDPCGTPYLTSMHSGQLLANCPYSWLYIVLTFVWSMKPVVSLSFAPPVSGRSLHTRHPDNKGVPRWRGDLRTEPSGHVQPHLPSGEETSGGPDQRRLQIHVGGRGPGHGCRRELPSALPGHRYESRQGLQIMYFVLHVKVNSNFMYVYP